MGLLQLLNPGEILAQIITFILLLLLLRTFVWKRFLKLLDERKQTIASEFRKIEETKDELAAFKADYDDRMKNIEDTAKAKIQEAVSEGKRLSEAILEDAKEQAAKMIENANDTIAVELSKAKKELKDTIVDLSISAAKKVVEAKITEKDDRKLVEDFLRGVDKI
jgi:F-type H+-transporting ATPase subunit b